MRNKGPVKREKCGTCAGYAAHSYYGEQSCEECKKARAIYQRNRMFEENTKIECGTVAGYRRHLYRGEPTCEVCREANRTRRRLQRQNHREQVTISSKLFAELYLNIAPSEAIRIMDIADKELGRKMVDKVIASADKITQ